MDLMSPYGTKPTFRGSFRHVRSGDEVIARVSDLTMARAMFDLAVVQFPGKLIMLCQKGRILRRSDRPS
jgi:hypothetical protein